MKRYLDLFKNTWTEFSDDQAQSQAAALAYYTIFSIAPLLLIAIAIAGLVFGRSQAQAAIVDQLRQLFGAAGGKAIEDMLTNAAKPKSGTLALIIGFVTLLFGAAGVFGQLKQALNVIWNVEQKKTGGIAAMIKQRFLSFAMVLGVGFLLLVSLVIDAAIASIGKYASSHLPGGQFLWQALQLIVSFGVITVLFAMIFRFLPDIRIEWHDVWFGAAFTSLLFVLGKFALGLYLGRKSVGSAYGAAGSLVVLLLWIYWSASILFFGAEFTQVYAKKHGSMRAPVEDRRPRLSGQPGSAVLHGTPQPATSGGAMKLALGGAIGVVLGALLGGLSATLLLVKSLKKLFT
jgi:membrane protein